MYTRCHIATTCLSCDSHRWRKVLTATPHDVYHLPAYLQLSGRQEGGTGMAFLAEEDDQRLLLPLILRPVHLPHGEGPDGIDATSPHGYPGPLLTNPTHPDTHAFLARALAALVEELRQREVVSLFVRLHPLFDLPLTPFREAGHLLYHGDTVSVDLTQPAGTLWHETRASSRNEINRAHRAGLRVVHDAAWTHFEDFFEIYHQTMARVSARSFYFFERSYFATLRAALGDALHLFVVQAEGHIVGAGLFTEINGIVHYFLSGTRAAYLPLHPAKMLLDHVRTWAKARGNTMLHLGGGVGASNDSLFFFKAGFSPRRFPFHTWRAIIDPAGYDALHHRRFSNGAAKTQVNGFFPAYRYPLD